MKLAQGHIAISSIMNEIQFHPSPKSELLHFYYKNVHTFLRKEYTMGGGRGLKDESLSICRVPDPKRHGYTLFPSGFRESLDHVSQGSPGTFASCSHPALLRPLRR